MTAQSNSNSQEKKVITNPLFVDQIFERYLALLKESRFILCDRKKSRHYANGDIVDTLGYDQETYVNGCTSYSCELYSEYSFVWCGKTYTIVQGGANDCGVTVKAEGGSK